MSGSSYKIEDFVMNLTNFQCMVFRQMSEASDRQSKAMESIASSVKNLVDFMTVKDERSTQTSTTLVESEEIESEPSQVQPKEDFDPSSEIFCHDCKATFVRGTGHFTKHLKFTPCRPYKCHCGKLFKKKSSLTAHKATHSTKVFRCETCPAFFRCGQYLRNHERRMHKVEKTEGSDDITTTPIKSMKLEKYCKTSPETPESTSFDPMEILKLQY